MKRLPTINALIGAALWVCWSPHALAAGFLVDASYTADLMANLDGGVKTGRRYLDNLDLTLAVDAEAAWGGIGQGFAYLVYNNDREFSPELVGDLQVVDNIDTPGGVRVMELWYELPALREATTLKLGLYDVNSEFDVLETNRVFINSSQGIGADFAQSGENGPSIFPLTSLGARLQHTTDRWAIRAVVLDAVPGDDDDPSETGIAFGDGALGVIEGEVMLTPALRALAGAWGYSAKFDPIGTGPTGAPRRGNDGWYLGSEWLIRVSEDRSWNAFARYGRADPRFNPFDGYLGFGVTATGLVPGRATDTIGLAAAVASTGADYRRQLRAAGALPGGRETALELLYTTALTRWLELTVNVQRVLDPAGREDIESAWVAGIRLTAGIARSF